MAKAMHLKSIFSLRLSAAVELHTLVVMLNVSPARFVHTCAVYNNRCRAIIILYQNSRDLSVVPFIMIVTDVIWPKLSKA